MCIYNIYSQMTHFGRIQSGHFFSKIRVHFFNLHKKTDEACPSPSLVTCLLYIGILLYIYIDP